MPFASAEVRLSSWFRSKEPRRCLADEGGNDGSVTGKIKKALAAGCRRGKSCEFSSLQNHSLRKVLAKLGERVVASMCPLTSKLRTSRW